MSRPGDVTCDAPPAEVVEEILMDEESRRRVLIRSDDPSVLRIGQAVCFYAQFQEMASLFGQRKLPRNAEVPSPCVRLESPAEAPKSSPGAATIPIVSLFRAKPEEYPLHAIVTKYDVVQITVFTLPGNFKGRSITAKA